MSCTPYKTIEVVNVPGTPGQAAFSYTTGSAWLTPAIGSTFVVPVASVAPYYVGQTVAFNYSNQSNGVVTGTVSSIDPVGMTLTITMVSGTVGIAAPTGTAVLPLAPAGAAGNNGINGFATSVATAFVIPSVGATQVFAVDNTTPFTVGQTVLVIGSNNALPPVKLSGYSTWTVNNIGSLTSITLTYVGSVADQVIGSHIYPPVYIVPSGFNGVSSFTTLTPTQITIPAIGSTVSTNVGNNAWMTVGAVVVMPGPAHFSVVSVNGNGTGVVLQFLGYSGDVAAGNVIVNGSVVAPSGTQPFFSSNQQYQSQGGSYAVTTSFAAITFSAVVSQIVLPTAGTWIINADATIKGILGGTATGVITTQLFRNNNTFGAVVNSEPINYIAPTTVGMDTQLGINGYPYVTTTAGDIISLYAQATVTSGSGTTVDIYSTVMSAFRIA